MQAHIMPWVIFWATLYNLGQPWKTHLTFKSSPLPKAQKILYKKIPLFRGKAYYQSKKGLLPIKSHKLSNGPHLVSPQYT